MFHLDKFITVWSMWWRNSKAHMFFFSASFQELGNLARSRFMLTLSIPWYLKKEVKWKVSPSLVGLQGKGGLSSMFRQQLEFSFRILYKFEIYPISGFDQQPLLPYDYQSYIYICFWWKIITFQFWCELNVIRCDIIKQWFHWTQGHILWKEWMAEYSLRPKQKHFP